MGVRSDCVFEGYPAGQGGEGEEAGWGCRVDGLGCQARKQDFSGVARETHKSPEKVLKEDELQVGCIQRPVEGTVLEGMVGTSVNLAQNMRSEWTKELMTGCDQCERP